MRNGFRFLLSATSIFMTTRSK